MTAARHALALAVIVTALAAQPAGEPRAGSPQAGSPQAGSATRAAGAAAPRRATALPGNDERWIRVDTPNFTLLSHAGKGRTISVGRKLEQLREVLAHITEGMTLTSPLPTTIYVFDDTASFNRYSIGEDGRPEEVAGYFVRTGNANYVAVDISASSLPYAVIYHEYLHYVLENSLPGIPLWLNEGIAEFYSTFRLRGNWAEIGRPLRGHMDWLERHAPMGLEELFAVETSSEDYNEGDRRGTFYAQSWALAHMLLTDDAFRQGSGRLLALLRQGQPSASAFETAYGTSLEDVRKKMLAHLRTSAGRYLTYKPEDGFTVAEATVTALERKAVLYHLGDLLAHRPPIQEEAAEHHLQAALAIDPAFADAIVALASLRLSQGRPDQAAELAARALAAAPDHDRALVISGTSLLDQVVQGHREGDPLPDEVPPLLLQARERFRQVLERSPGHVDALIGLGNTYTLQPADVGEGIAALARASHAQPARDDVLATLIALTARSGNVAAARTLLDRGLRPRGDTEAIRVAESGLTEALMAGILEQIERGKIEQATEQAAEAMQAITRPELRAELEAWVQRVVTSHEFERLRQQALAAGRTGDGELARELLGRAEALGGSLHEDDLEVARFNQAVALGNLGQHEQAAELFAEIAGTARRDDLREQAAHHASELRRVAEQNRSVDLFNEAVNAFNGGRFAEAEATLDRLLAERELPEDLRQQAEHLRGAAQRARGFSPAR